MLREWACQGLGAILKNEWDIQDELQTGRLETALDSYNAGDIDLYGVQPAGPANRRVTALVEFLAAALASPSPRSSFPGSPTMAVS